MKIILYFNTIRYLKIEQIFYQIYYRLVKYIPAHSQYSLKTRVKKNKFFDVSRKPASLINQNTFKFFGKTGSLLDDGWKVNRKDKLWQYNLNYFDDLNAENSIHRKEWHEFILKSWLNENEYEQNSVAWEPYPTSLRSVNWIKWVLLNNTLTNECLTSLHYHGVYLEKKLERHILGNHLFSNAKALIFLGIYFQTTNSDRWLRKGLKIVKKEIKEQILNDGGNFELSPSYHVNFLEDILDIINILKTYDLNLHFIKRNLIKDLESIAKKMIQWLFTMTWQDGSLPSFNDSANNISSSLKNIIEYASRLGIKEYEIKKEKNLSYSHLKESGYLVIYQNNNKIILDVGEIGPKYLTAHSHADTLSFEMTFNSQKVLVNSGTSCYGESSRRHFERSTKAHNTVEISNRNSSEVWAGFRVANRAFPKNLSIKDSSSSIKINCSHDGYNSFIKKCIHRRSWIIEDNKITIEDNIIGQKVLAIGRLIFHNEIKILKLKENEYNLTLLDEAIIKVNVKKGSSKLIDWKCTDVMGSIKNTFCLEVLLDNNESLIEIA